MKHYYFTLGEFFGDETVPEGATEITVEEINAYNASQVTPEQLAEQAKAEALRYLTDTDWYVVRLTETGVAIPEEVSIKRAEARAIL